MKPEIVASYKRIARRERQKGTIDNIVKFDGKIHHFKVVITIFQLSKDLKGKVDFGVSFYIHCFFFLNCTSFSSLDNSKYDSRRSDENITDYKSDIAYGPLIQGYGICGGYTDAMELILEKLKVKGYKISSDNHIWNAVYINDKWSHLDLTWDDPVVSDGSQMIDHAFYLVDTKSLLEKENTEHDFNQNVYTELKQN